MPGSAKNARHFQRRSRAQEAKEIPVGTHDVLENKDSYGGYGKNVIRAISLNAKELIG